MQINELIDGIIKTRNAKLPMIISKKNELMEIEQAMDEFDSFKNSIVDADGNVLDGPFTVFAQENPDLIANLEAMSTFSVRNKVKIALDECEKVYKRFSRERLNIAVVGKARVGKSEMLQSISNLSNKVIPAFDDTDCTGAVSAIENHPGKQLKAYITFKNEAQIVEIVQKYLDDLIPSEEKRIVVRSLYNIRDLDLDEVQKRMEAGRGSNNRLPYLRKYVMFYEEWAPYITKKELVLDDESEIQEYVAQNNGVPEGNPGRKNFYKFLAVDSCRIECSFDYSQAGSVTLIDTIGFDDNAIGIDDQLIQVVNDKSDAVIFVLFPVDLAGGGVPATITKTYTKIQESCKSKDLDKWLFWLINHAPNHPKTPNPRSNCETTLKTLEENGWSGEIKKIIDVSDQKQVREEFLIPLLTTLTNNLDSIDELYFEDLKNALSEVRKVYGSFCMSASKMMSSKIEQASNMHPFITKKINEAKKNLRTEIKKLAMNEREKRNIPCKELAVETNQIIESMRNESLLPSIEDVKDEVAANDQLGTIYTYYCNIIRTEITQRFSDVNISLQSLVQDMKNSIANVLYNECRLGNIMKMSDKQPYEWVDDFADNILLSERDYPNLYPAFKNIQKFDFSVKGFLTYEVRACLDNLDPGLTDTPALHSVGNPVDNIRFWLDRNLISTADELEERINELLNKPNRAFFAFIKEFGDKVIYGEGVDEEWETLYSGKSSIVWSEEYKNWTSGTKSLEAWSDLLSKLLELNSNLQQLTI